MGKTTFSVGLLLMGVGLISCLSCQTWFRGSKKIAHQDFYICNRWIDENRDGYMALGELAGIRGDFQIGQDRNITFISIWRKKKEVDQNMKLWSPDRNLVYGSRVNTIPSDSASFNYVSFSLAELACRTAESSLAKWVWLREHEWFRNLDDHLNQLNICCDRYWQAIGNELEKHPDALRELLVGTWTVEWYLNNKLFEAKTFTISD